jgi:hypothetical protein
MSTPPPPPPESDYTKLCSWSLGGSLVVLQHNFKCVVYIFFDGATASRGPGPPHYRVFTITFRSTTLGRTPLDEWSAQRRDLYLTTHNTHKSGIRPTIAASERPQTHALDRAATGICIFIVAILNEAQCLIVFCGLVWRMDSEFCEGNHVRSQNFNKAVIYLLKSCPY